MLFSCVLLTLFSILFFQQPNAWRVDAFASLVEIENLVGNEASITASVIDSYVQRELGRLERLKAFAYQYAHLSEYVDETAITNPVGAYQLIKRLANDWNTVKELMTAENIGNSFLANITDGWRVRSVRFPGDNDLEGAAVGVLRLQRTYRLSTAHLANGTILIGGAKRANSKMSEDLIATGDSTSLNTVASPTTKPLSAQDCFEIGMAAFNSKDLQYAAEWMAEALSRHPPYSLQITILENYINIQRQRGYDIIAYDLAIYLAEIDRGNQRAVEFLIYYGGKLRAQKNAQLQKGTEADDNDEEGEEEEDEGEILELSNEETSKHEFYESICRGETVVPPKRKKYGSSKLHCYHKSGPQAFLRIAPIRVELLSNEPKVALFRNVISNSEIDAIKTIATPSLSTALVQDGKDNTISTYRISRMTWLQDYQHPVVERLSKRIELMTDLDQSTAEQLQVANYGIGGHYGPHYDCLFSREFEKDKTGFDAENRIATVLFYLSQPEKGGITAFTKLGIGVAPQLNDALFWYNVRRDGNCDLRTEHAGCPVLSGVKWVFS